MTSIREISFHRTRNSILLERVSGVSIMCCCRAGVSSFSFSCLRGRGRGGVRGDSVALLSVVNSGNKGAAKRKLHRNKISSFPLPPPVLQVSCYLFFDYTAYLDTVSDRLSLRINLLPPKISKGFPLQNFIHQRIHINVTPPFRYRISPSFQVYVQSDARMSVASSMFDFEQFSNSSFLDIMDIYILELFLCKLYRNDYCIVNRVVYNIRV